MLHGNIKMMVGKTIQDTHLKIVTGRLAGWDTLSRPLTNLKTLKFKKSNWTSTVKIGNALLTSRYAAKWKVYLSISQDARVSQIISTPVPDLVCSLYSCNLNSISRNIIPLPTPPRQVWDKVRTLLVHPLVYGTNRLCNACLSISIFGDLRGCSSSVYSNNEALWGPDADWGMFVQTHPTENNF